MKCMKGVLCRNVFIEEYENYGELEQKGPDFAKNGKIGVISDSPLWFLLEDEESGHLLLVYKLKK